MQRCLGNSRAARPIWTLWRDGGEQSKVSSTLSLCVLLEEATTGAPPPVCRENKTQPAGGWDTGQRSAQGPVLPSACPPFTERTGRTVTRGAYNHGAMDCTTGPRGSSHLRACILVGLSAQAGSTLLGSHEGRELDTALCPWWTGKMPLSSPPLPSTSGSRPLSGWSWSSALGPWSPHCSLGTCFVYSSSLLLTKQANRNSIVLPLALGRDEG